MAAQLQERDGSGGAREELREALAVLGLREDLAEPWLEGMVAQAVQDGGAHPSVQPPEDGAEVIAGMVAMARARCAVDATVLVSVQDLVLRTGEGLLAERGVDDPTDLGITRRAAWRAEVKSSVAGELQVALGVGVTEARQLVAVACLPGDVRAPVLGALRRGEVHWALVRRFQTRTARLDVADAARVAQAMFGTDPQAAAVERLDPDGELTSRPWHQAEYYAALDREVARHREEDETSAAQEREQAHAARGAGLEVHEDGTATFTVTGSLATMVALSGRIEGMARRCRKAGDERTLDQLRADIVACLLIFGVVDLPGPDEDDPDAIITPADVEALRSIVEATPAGQVELVVPWDALLGRVVCPRCDGRAVGPVGVNDPPSDDPPLNDPSPPGGSPPGGSPPGAGPSPEPDSPPNRDRPRHEDEPAQDDRARPRWVGELRGSPAGWVTPAEAREIALRPGSTFYRLLTDPADGRCIERTIARYAPDADMRRQIRAADVYGRGPGCRRPASACELDHEHEHADGGPTTEVNLNAKAKLDHWRKTKRLVRTTMNRRRDLTWTTLLGQVARTRSHDYRQYADAFDRLAPGPAPGGPTDQADLAARRDLANQVLYAAIVARAAGERAGAEDDVPGSEDWLVIGDWRTVTHRGEDGVRRAGPPPRPVTPEEILGMVDPDSGAAGADGAEHQKGRSDGPGWTCPDDTPPPF